MNQKPDTNSRPPIVTLMGHVDHGKTTLLDTIRKTNVVAREAGGITQHLGAYQITFQDKPITFIDTPGHAAFEKMRSRGAEVADIAILVVAANDGVKPQTIEAIKHIKNAKCPIIVALTKVDLADINVEKVKKELTAGGIAIESYGGDVPVVEVAAPKNKGISELLELILLVWDLKPEASLPNDSLEAVVGESYLDKKRGPIASVIVKKGTLKAGHKITVNQKTITVRALTNDRGQNIKEAIPGQPVEILGFKHVLDVGSIVSEKISPVTGQVSKAATSGEIIAKSQEVKNKFKVIIRADVTGSLEAILANLPANVLALSSSTGQISQNDIEFAKTANAPIITFNLKIPRAIENKAKTEGVYLKNYQVIYQLLEDIKEVVAGFEQAKQQAKIIGRAKIVASFDITGQKIAGAKVSHGKISLGDRVILVRQDHEIAQTKISSLKRFKKDQEIISAGQDCGIGFSPSLDFTIGDIIESFGS